MNKQLTAIAEEARSLLGSKDERIKLEAIKVMAAVHGVLIPDSVHLTDPQAEYASRYLREVVVGRLVVNSATRRKINRRQFLKREIAKMEAAGDNSERLEAFQKELAASLASRKRIPLSEVPSPAAQSTAAVPVVPSAPMDPAIRQRGLETAQKYLRSLEKNTNE
jgi:hypothetical protein